MKHRWRAKDVVRQIRQIELAQRRIMICRVTKLGRQGKRATNVSFGVNAALWLNKTINKSWSRMLLNTLKSSYKGIQQGAHTF